MFFLSFILSPIALIFGIAALFKNGSKIWGVLGIIFAIIGILTSLWLIAFFSVLFAELGFN